MADRVQKNYPAVKGLLWHRDQFYSFFIPNHWQRLRWSDGREGVVYCPDATDVFTVFAVDVKDLLTPIKADDLDILAEGFFEGITQLPDSHIDSRNQTLKAQMPRLEAKYTFSEQGATRKCWTQVFYHRTRQITMTAQGATREKYDYWLPWFFEAMMTAKVHQEKPTSPY